MGMPTLPRPQLPLLSDKDRLLDIVTRCAADELRAWLDDAFWQGKPTLLTWDHLTQALVNRDRPMIRLLVLNGVAATEGDLRQLKQNAGEEYPTYLRLLRQAGHRVDKASLQQAEQAAADFRAAAERQAKAEEEAEAQNPFRDHKLSVLPQEWLQVLKAVQVITKNDAVIAGGALRDTFNARPVKDVDIFLPTLGSEGKNRKFIKKLFEWTALKIEEEVVHDGYGGTEREFPKPRSGKMTMTLVEHRVGEGFEQKIKVKAALPVQSWKIKAGPKKTEYNFVFITDGEHTRKLKLTGKVLASFDIGLCQVATNGEGVFVSEEYKKDLLEKTLTLHRENDGSLDHLERVMKKYPDFTLSRSAKDFLVEARKPKGPPPRMSYS